MTRLNIALVGILSAALIPVSAARAQTTDTLRLVDVVELARRMNPMLRAAWLEADAASQRVSPAGALPDPMLQFGLRNRPINDFGSTDQMMTMNWIGLAQRFPWPGKLGFSEDKQELLAAAASSDADEMEAALVAGVKSVYYNLAYMDRALGIMDATRDLLRDFLQVTTAKYEVGVGLQQDILQAQVAVAQVTADITVVRQNRLAMAARLNAFLGRPATIPIGHLELPDTADPLPDVELLLEQAAVQRPALQAARQRVQAAEAGYRAARRAVYPDITVQLGYGQRPQFDDLATIMLGVSVPLFAGSKQLPQRREMQAVQLRQEAREVDLYNETFARLSELRAVAERARDLLELYRTSILPQAVAAVESALSAYRVGGVDYMTLLANQMTVNRFEIESVRLMAEYHGTVAGIEALTGTDTEVEAP